MLGCLLVPVADVAIWTRWVILDGERFAALADDFLDREAVRDALAERIVAESAIGQSPVPLEPLVADGLATPAFEPVFAAAIRQMHGQLVHDADRLSLNLDPALALVREEVGAVAPEIADELPTEAEFGEIVIVERDQAPYVWIGAKAGRWGSAIAIGLAAVLLGAGVALAPRRWLALGVAGVGVVLASLLLVVVVTGAQEVAARWASSQVDRDAFDATWDVIEESLFVQTLLVAVMGVAAAVAGFLLEVASARRAV